MMKTEFDIETKLTKRLFYVDATPEKYTPEKVIECVAASYGYKLVPYKFQNRSEFDQIFKKQTDPIDILYISAHGKKDGIELEDKARKNSSFIDWDSLSSLICEAEGLGEETNIFLACCNGGFRRVALKFMSYCQSVDFVAGLPCELYSRREALAFHTFLDHINRGSDSSRIESAVTNAIDQQFKVYLRYEMDVEIALYHDGYDENHPFELIDDTT